MSYLSLSSYHPRHHRTQRRHGRLAWWLLVGLAVVAGVGALVVYRMMGS